MLVFAYLAARNKVLLDGIFEAIYYLFMSAEILLKFFNAYSIDLTHPIEQNKNEVAKQTILLGRCTLVFLNNMLKRCLLFHFHYDSDSEYVARLNGSTGTLPISSLIAVASGILT